MGCFEAGWRQEALITGPRFFKETVCHGDPADILGGESAQVLQNATACLQANAWRTLAWQPEAHLTRTVQPGISRSWKASDRSQALVSLRACQMRQIQGKTAHRRPPPRTLQWEWCWPRGVSSSRAKGLLEKAKRAWDTESKDRPLGKRKMENATCLAPA